MSRLSEDLDSILKYPAHLFLGTTANNEPAAWELVVDAEGPERTHLELVTRGPTWEHVLREAKELIHKKENQ